MGIAELVRAQARGERRASDLLDACLARVAEHNGRLRALLALDPAAHERARALDEAAEVAGPLHGIVVAIKDNIETGEGLATTAGSLALADNVAARDAPLVARLREAGAVIIGKANLSEWANFRSRWSISGWSAVGGQTRNPHDESRSPSGSSSGSAVAVATGMAHIAIGTETNGSIVSPAAVCGVVGFKPTIGRIEQAGVVPIAASQDTAGPMGRSVDDVATAYAVMCGAPLEPGSARTDVRFGVVRSLAGFHPAVDAEFESALTALRAAGFTLRDDLHLDPPRGFRRAGFEVLCSEFKDGIDTYLAGAAGEGPKSLAELIAFNAGSERELEYFGQDIFEHCAQLEGTDGENYRKAHALVRRATREEGIDALLAGAGVDVLLAPTSSPAWPIDPVNGDHVLGSAAAYPAIAGYPHLTLPMGQVALPRLGGGRPGALPVGISVFAGAGDDDLVLDAGRAVEAALADRR